MEISPELGLLSHWVYACLVLVDAVNFLKYTDWYSPANAGDIRDAGGHGDTLQYSCLENPMDRGAWRAIVYMVTKSWTRLKRLGTHAIEGNRL